MMCLRSGTSLFFFLSHFYLLSLRRPSLEPTNDDMNATCPRHGPPLTSGDGDQLERQPAMHVTVNSTREHILQDYTSRYRSKSRLGDLVLRHGLHVDFLDLLCFCFPVVFVVSMVNTPSNMHVAYMREERETPTPSNVHTNTKD